MSHKPKYFEIYELVPPQVYKDRGERAWELLNPVGLIVLDRLREKFGSATINDWYWGGRYKESGLRTPDCKDYRKYSQHSFGNAYDVKFKNHSAEEVRQYILDNPDEFPEIRGIELDVSWLHIDFRNCELKVFRP